MFINVCIKWKELKKVEFEVKYGFFVCWMFFLINRDRCFEVMGFNIYNGIFKLMDSFFCGVVYDVVRYI